MVKVKNANEELVEFKSAVQLMDDEIRENLHSLGLKAQEFFEAYAKEHKKKFGTEFVCWVGGEW